jgi:hypothetical protein
MHPGPLLLECAMGLVLPSIAVYPGQHLPIVKAYANKMGLVEGIKGFQA